MTITIDSQQHSVTFERIDSVRFDARTLSIRFGDGLQARISIDLLQKYWIDETDWPNVSAEEFHIRVPTANGNIEIPWDELRYYADPSFRDEWDEAMLNAGRVAGARLRWLREQRGVSTAQLAQRIQVSEESVRAIESGQSNQPRLELHILDALGFTLADLAVDR